MKYYLDITLLPNTEITLGFIWQKIYQQVHIALVENKIGANQSAIAISFPNYGKRDDAKAFPLGEKLRLFADKKETLETIAIDNWLKRFTDYVHITSIKEVPSSVEQYAVFCRKQFNTNVERLARRRVKRHNESYEQALTFYKSFNDDQSKLPFINVKSLSKDQQFKLFVDRALGNRSINGDFNCYGLSKGTATVPWF